jgi:SAM-dependent methyltransferase
MTSYVNIGQWWKSEPGRRYYVANLAALNRGATVRRVFITRKQLKDEIKQEVLAQTNDGIDVRVAFEEDLASDRQLNFSVLHDTKQPVVTWSSLTPSGGASEGHLSFNEADIQRHLEIFESLWHHKAVEPTRVWNDLRISEGKLEVDSSKAPILPPALGTEVRNILYSKPELYDVFHAARFVPLSNMIHEVFRRYCSKMPTSLLDVGCGTCAYLSVLEKDIHDSWGIDAQKSMIDYATLKHPTLRLKVGDMRTMDLGRTFDCVLCVGWVLNYATRNSDIDVTLRSIVRHCHKDSLLILELINAASLLPGGKRNTTETVGVNHATLAGEATTIFEFDRENQLLRRTRKWKLHDGSNPTDYCSFRMLFPSEIEHFLEEHGFRVLQSFDNHELKPGDLIGESLFIAARYCATTLQPLH